MFLDVIVFVYYYSTLQIFLCIMFTSQFHGVLGSEYKILLTLNYEIMIPKTIGHNDKSLYIYSSKLIKMILFNKLETTPLASRGTWGLEEKE